MSESKWQPSHIRRINHHWCNAGIHGKCCTGVAWYRSIFFTPDRLKSYASQHNRQRPPSCGESRPMGASMTRQDGLAEVRADGQGAACTRHGKLDPNQPFIPKERVITK